MMTNSYGAGLQGIQELNHRLLEIDFDYEREIAEAVKNNPSRLDAYDYLYSITLGVLSAILDTNDKIADFLDEIHRLSSAETVNTDDPVKRILAKALHHHGDYMDKPLTNKVNKNGKPLKEYISRSAKRKDGVMDVSDSAPISGPHRIFWGHDIFSIHGDNPFVICIQQYGIGRGVLQAVRHLVADTCSHQGLPLPFSSYFDYIEVTVGADGEVTEKTCNRLLDFCQKYSEEVLGKRQTGINNEVFNHMFSIHMQDILSKGLVLAGIEVYCKGRKITDATRKVQMQIIGYFVTAYGSALLGAVTHNGIPFINWPVFAALSKSVLKMFRITQEEIDKIYLETERLITEGDVLEIREQRMKHQLISGLYMDLSNVDQHSGRNALIDFF